MLLNFFGGASFERELHGFESTLAAGLWGRGRGSRFGSPTIMALEDDGGGAFIFSEEGAFFFSVGGGAATSLDLATVTSLLAAAGSDGCRSETSSLTSLDEGCRGP